MDMDSSRLPCGVLYDTLLTQVADHTAPAAPAHQATCPHCRATLAELDDLWDPLHELAQQQVRAPRDLLPTVMARVRDLSRHSWFAFVLSERGHTRIAARVVAAVARLAAENVPHVTLALGGGRTGTDSTPAQIAGPRGEAATDVGVSGSHVVVDIQIAIEIGAHIPTVGDHVRAQVSDAIAAHLGLRTAEVNVTVADVQPGISGRSRT
jgi:uncharacterized alkaline shock family protein YloU